MKWSDRKGKVTLPLASDMVKENKIKINKDKDKDR